MSHIGWRDDIARTCACGHAKGSHAIAGGPCANIPACPCQGFEPQQEKEPDD